MSLKLKLLKHLAETGGQRSSREIEFSLRGQGMPVYESCGIDHFLLLLSEERLLTEELRNVDGRNEAFYQISTAGSGRIEELERAAQHETAPTPVVRQKAMF
jgi:hypothetical protein